MRTLGQVSACPRGTGTDGSRLRWCPLTHAAEAHALSPSSPSAPAAPGLSSKGLCAHNPHGLSHSRGRVSGAIPVRSPSQHLPARPPPVLLRRRPALSQPQGSALHRPCRSLPQALAQQPGATEAEGLSYSPTFLGKQCPVGRGGGHCLSSVMAA